jgi:hypothetical protein
MRQADSPSTAVVGHCPHWCTHEHPADTSGSAFYHVSETASITISRPDHLTALTAPERLDVQVT